MGGNRWRGEICCPRGSVSRDVPPLPTTERREVLGLFRFASPVPSQYLEH